MGWTGNSKLSARDNKLKTNHISCFTATVYVILKQINLRIWPYCVCYNFYSYMINITFSFNSRNKTIYERAYPLSLSFGETRWSEIHSALLNRSNVANWPWWITVASLEITISSSWNQDPSKWLVSEREKNFNLSLYC